MKSGGTPYVERLKYRFYVSGVAKWTKMHSYAATVHYFLLRVQKRSRFKLVQSISFRLSLKVFEFCNFCFEMHYFFVLRAEQFAHRKTPDL